MKNPTDPVYDGDEDDADDMYDNEEWDDPLAEAEMNCGLMRDGYCSMAGSEYCDWDCPFSR